MENALIVRGNQNLQGSETGQFLHSEKGLFSKKFGTDCLGSFRRFFVQASVPC